MTLATFVLLLPFPLKPGGLCEMAHTAEGVCKEVVVDGVEGSGGSALGFRASVTGIAAELVGRATVTNVRDR